MKKVCSVILAVLCVIPILAVFAGAEENDTVVCGNINELSEFIFEGGSGEITIAPAILNDGSGSRDVYLVAALGMTFDMKKPNNMIAAVLTAFNVKTEYYKIVKAAILGNVPANSELLLMGHSLGGMVMQQIMSDNDVTDVYEITSVVTIGSPYVMTPCKPKEGNLTRFADRFDAVPKLSPALFFNIKSYFDATTENGGYFGDPDRAHNRSYRDAEVWNKYDVLGRPDGQASFSYSPSEVIGISAQKKQKNVYC